MNLPADYDPFTEKEKVPCRIFPQARDASRVVAEEIANLIRTTASQGKTCVLGLPTGSTPVGIYNQLVRMHSEEGLSFANVITFNLDEYYPMRPEELQSYVRFMREHLFDRIDISESQVHVPDGRIPFDRVNEFCRLYEQQIVDAGGIDIQLLGIGRTGHIGFNEPGSSSSSRTRLITLDQVTRIDAASDFFGAENVPRRAITMGVGSILEARKVYLLSFGEQKSAITAQAIEGEMSKAVAASFLQEHPCAQFILDEPAAADLTRRRSPWILGPVEWDEDTIRKAVIWLARQLGKPILKLTDEDYNENGLQDLLVDHGPAYDINLQIFRHLQATIIGWPGGKPEHEKKSGDRPQPHDEIFPKRMLVFAPHPDDDVISMGGTLTRLVDQGHQVHVAYQTSGNIAVFDDDVIRYTHFVTEFNQQFNGLSSATHDMKAEVEQAICDKQVSQIDTDQIQGIKTLIRRCEAQMAGRCCGISLSQLHFLNMPFYETGRVRKKPLSEDDVHMVVQLLQTIQPHQIYAAGDLSDPHGTHRTCLSAVLQACHRVQHDDWYASTTIWLYRGAWQEWSPHEIEMAVPLSPAEVSRKRNAIFKHESQKDRALFPGPDMREFWQRAEQRNQQTASLYDALGLADYEAIEGFVRWRGDMRFV